MKTRTWILILSCLLLLCGSLSLMLLRPGENALSVEIFSSGSSLGIYSLLEDQALTVPGPAGGSNTIEIRSGKIAVTAATCPDHHCMHRGFCSRGPSIICLPNALEIRFLAPSQVDIPLG